MLPFKKIFTKGKSVLILGFGKEGRSTYGFLKKYFPGCRLGIADRNKALAEENLPVPMYLGRDYLQAVQEYDLIMKSPGVKLWGLPGYVQKKVTSQTDLFLRAFGKQTIGITGTKGKSTTASLIYHLLKNTGKSALLMGNIGLPAFDFIEKLNGNELIVYELSAHQLEIVHRSPHIAVLLNLFPEHLDYFGTFEKYKQAKINIFRFQKPGDSIFCGEQTSGIFSRCKSVQDLKGIFHSEDLLLRSGLKGEHNLNNILLAFTVLQQIGVPLAKLPMALTGFAPLPHRLEYVGNHGGIDFFNDSISTVPQSTMAAVKSIPKADTIILGGFDRGLDYAELVAFLENTDIKYLFLMGKAGKQMQHIFQLRNSRKNLIPVKDLQEAFSYLKRLPDVSCCLLSPAAASYDQFHNFEHRGDIFKKLATDFGMEIKNGA